MVRRVLIAKLAARQLRKAPPQVRNAFSYWIGLVAEHGLLEVRKIRGFHDESIARGAHAGQRSIRLSRSWRAFYVLESDGAAELVEVVEVNKHLYDR
jgi:toxin HigB-1